MPSAFGGAASPIPKPAQDAPLDDVRLAIDKRISRSQRTSFSWLHDLTAQGKIKKGQRYMLEGYNNYLDAKKYMYPDEHRQLKDAVDQIVEASKKVRTSKGIMPKAIQVCVFGKNDFLTPEEFLKLASSFRERARTVSDAILMESHIRSKTMVDFTIQESVGDLLQSTSDGDALDPALATSRAGFNLVDAMVEADSEIGSEDGQRFEDVQEAMNFLANEANLDCVGLYIHDGSSLAPSDGSSTGASTDGERLPRSVPRTMPGGFSELESFATAVFEIREPARPISAS